MRPILPEDAQAPVGFYLLPDDVLVEVRASRTTGRTYALRYFPDAPAEAGPPWVFTPGLAGALAGVSPLSVRDAVRVVGRLLGNRAA